ncbi:MAG: modified peptide precursor CbpA [Steroidobacteraceae bacterium]
MTQTVLTQPQAQRVSSPSPAIAPAIAVRKTCNPDGVGLSHYVLMDKKGAR